MMDRLDAAARKAGEPEGLTVRYAVDITLEGLRVFRGADLPRPSDIDAPDGYVEVYCHVPEQISADDEWLGPVFVERPAEHDEPDPLQRVDLRVMICEKQINPSLAEIFPFSGNRVASGSSLLSISSVDSDKPGVSPPSSKVRPSSSHPQLTRHASGISPPKRIGDSRTLRPKAVQGHQTTEVRANALEPDL